MILQNHMMMKNVKNINHNDVTSKYKSSQTLTG